MRPTAQNCSGQWLVKNAFARLMQDRKLVAAAQFLCCLIEHHGYEADQKPGMSASAGHSGNQVEAGGDTFGRIAHTPVRFAVGSTDDAIYREGSQIPGKRLLESLLGHKLAAEWAESETGRSVAGCKIDALHAGNGS